MVLSDSAKASQRLPAPRPGGITPIATGFTKSRRDVNAGFTGKGRLDGLEFSNLPHDFAETLELVFVGITIIVSLAIMVAFGRWWQK